MFDAVEPAAFATGFEVKGAAAAAVITSPLPVPVEGLNPPPTSILSGPVTPPTSGVPNVLLTALPT